MNYYNEHDPHAAAWLRSLIDAGLIPKGVVDDRSIAEVHTTDLAGFRQCHFFAGIAGWSLALQLAGWPEDREVWTGSCPCQPFSAAGKRKGTADERHLWPEFYRLIAECQPATVFGEQVASKDGLAWLDGVCADLEASGYAFGAADLCAAGIGEKNHPLIQAACQSLDEMADSLDRVGRSLDADELRDVAAYLGGVIVGPPHIRQRLWWVADADINGRDQGRAGIATARDDGLVGNGRIGRLANAKNNRASIDVREGRNEPDAIRSGIAGGLGLAQTEGSQIPVTQELSRAGRGGEGGGLERPGTWSDFDLVPCRDGKTRRIESGVSPLAHGIPGRVAQLRGLGNAIVPQVAAAFIKAYMSTEEA
jgi:DNA (cytosine-5)-methyltransferase 1